MPLPSFKASAALLFAAALPLCAPSSVLAETLEIGIKPGGSAAIGRPLPAGATPSFTITVKNNGTAATGPIEIFARFSGLVAVKPEGWQAQGGSLKSEIKSIAPGASVDRVLRLRVESAPIEAAPASVSVEARAPDGKASAEFALRIADCAGAYRARLAAMREALPQPSREAAEEMRKPDPALPAGRLFAATGSRAGELARAERLAAVFAARGGADPQMSTEWFRFMLARWASELNNYASQAANPGLCASNYYQIAGYRQGLLPVTKHLDATRTAAEIALGAARKEAALESASLDEIARALAKEAQVENAEEIKTALALLAAVRDSFNSGRRPDPALMRKLSIAETAAWLAETDTRGGKLVQAVEGTLGEISKAHKETCVCAF